MNHVHVFLFGLHLFTSAHGFDVGALDSQVMQRSYFYTLFGFFYPFLSMLYVKPFKFRKKQKNNSKQFDTFTAIHFYPQRISRPGPENQSCCVGAIP